MMHVQFDVEVLRTSYVFNCCRLVYPCRFPCGSWWDYCPGSHWWCLHDWYADEAEHGVTIKSTGISPFSPFYEMTDESLKNYKCALLLVKYVLRHVCQKKRITKVGDGNEYLINLPGHIDFSSEVTAALHQWFSSGGWLYWRCLCAKWNCALPGSW